MVLSMGVAHTHLFDMIVLMKRMITFAAGFIVGTIFLFSGFAKAADTAAFADLLGQYGASWIGFVAPMVVLVEVLLGLLLVFRVQVRRTAVCTVVFLGGVTLVYTYGLLFHGVTDCGCFGQAAVLNHSPKLTYGRNLLLSVLSLWLVWKGESRPLSFSVVVYVAMVAAVACFMTGFSFRRASVLKQTRQKEAPTHMLADTPLADYVRMSQDSTCLVFAFSYSCPYCLNSVNHISLYEEMGIVDRVIGLAVQDSVAETFFYRYFSPSFAIRNLPIEEMQRFTRTFPTAFFLHGDTIVNVVEGLMPHPVLLLNRSDDAHKEEADV